VLQAHSRYIRSVLALLLQKVLVLPAQTHTY
jgi:hypothetical protein